MANLSKPTVLSVSKLVPRVRDSAAPQIGPELRSLCNPALSRPRRLVSPAAEASRRRAGAPTRPIPPSSASSVLSRDRLAIEVKGLTAAPDAAVNGADFHSKTSRRVAQRVSRRGNSHDQQERRRPQPQDRDASHPRRPRPGRSPRLRQYRRSTTPRPCSIRAPRTMSRIAPAINTAAAARRRRRRSRTPSRTSKVPRATASRCCRRVSRRSRPPCCRCCAPATMCSSPTAPISRPASSATTSSPATASPRPITIRPIGAGIAALLQPNTRAVFVESAGLAHLRDAGHSRHRRGGARP